MAHYVVKVYGLICDECGATVECVPPIARNKLAAARRLVSDSPDRWVYRGGRDLCEKCKPI